MDLSTLQSYIGQLTNDPNHDRYTTDDIGQELDNAQDFWNISAKILKDTVTLTVVDGTRQYAISTLTGTPIAFTRTTHKGLELRKRDKSWMDLYSGVDWTTTTGTPTDYIIEVTDPDTQYITLYPTPTGNDAGAYLVVEYIKRHTTLSASTDTPFNSNTLLVPYHDGLAKDAAARLLGRDPNTENIRKIYGEDGKSGYAGYAKEVLSQVVDTFKALERSEPAQLRRFGPNWSRKWAY